MKANYKGQEIEAEEVDVLTYNEPWNEYQLSNGKVLKFKAIVTQILKAVDVKNPDGSDLYLFQYKSVTHVK